jgi:hypothetical protein
VIFILIPSVPPVKLLCGAQTWNFIMCDNVRCVAAGALFFDSSKLVGRLVRAKDLKNLAAAAAVLLASIGAAQATTIAVTYTVSYQNIGGNSPQINHDAPFFVRHYLGSYVNFSGHPGKYTTSRNLIPGGPESSIEYFLTVNPVSSGFDYGCGWNCSSHTASGIITADFTFYDHATGITNTLEETGFYSAKYHGSYLSCSGKSGSGQSDCVQWSTTSGPTLGSLATNFVTFAVALGTDLLDLTLYNAEDWTIYPKISFFLDPPVSQTPLPGALPLFASCVGMFGFIRWRHKKRKATKSGAAA